MKFFYKRNRSANLQSDYRARFYNSTFVKRASAKFPRLFQMIVNRFSLRKFAGLPLTLLAVSFVANISLLNEISESLENSPWMISVDSFMARFFFSIRTQTVSNAFLYFSKLGSLPVVSIVALFSVVVFTIKKKIIYLISVLIALTGAGLTISIGKNYFHRIRPDDYSFYKEPSYSFPSGHATIAIAFYGMLFYLIIRGSSGQHLKSIWTVIALLFVLLLGFSRLYLGVHYLSDVIAGYSLGFLWFLLSVSIIELRNTKQHV